MKETATLLYPTPVGLAPNATVEINLKAENSGSDSAFLVILTFDQFHGHEFFQEKTPAIRFNDYYSPSYWRQTVGKGIQTLHRIRAPSKDRYYVGLIQTGPPSKRLRGLTGTVCLVNPGKQHLPLQEANFPEVFFCAAWAFLLAAAGFFALLILRRRGRSRLHFLLLSNLLLKGLIDTLTWNDAMNTSRFGEVSVSRRVIWQILAKLQSIVELMILLLVALGWKLVRPHGLRPAEWVFAASVSFISLFLGLLEVVCHTMTTYSGRSYLFTRFTLHSLCYLVIVVATNFNLYMLNRQIQAALVGGAETGPLYVKAQSYFVFRIVFLIFILIPSVTIFIQVRILSWDQQWVYILFHEMLVWCVHVVLCILFRPGASQMQVFELAVDDGDDEDENDEELSS